MELESTLRPNGRPRKCTGHLSFVADAAPFHEGGIPNLSFATTGGYAHLHQTSDTRETLNPELFERATRLAFVRLWAVANMD